MKLAALLGVLADVVVLLAPPPARAANRIGVSVERFTLSNGLAVVLHPDHRVPQVAVDLLFRVGSKDEAPHRTGFAHLFEHMMFMGTKNVPSGQFDVIMETEGGTNNGMTTEDRTLYFEVGPSHLLETFLWLEADRMSSLGGGITQAKLDLQREVVKNERRQGLENQPYGVVEEALPEALFPVGHPYHHPIIGSQADLSAARVGDVRAFFHKYYVPSNASLVIAGDFAPEEARRLVERYFGWMARAPEPTHPTASVPPLTSARRVVLRDTVALPQVNLAWRSPGMGQPGDAECELLAAVLGGGDWSRLARTLVFERKIAESVQVEQNASRDAGTFLIAVIARPGRKPDELERTLDEELARLATEPPTEQELKRARAVVETKELEEIDSLTGLAHKLNELEYRYGDANELERSFLGRFRHVTVTALAQTAQVLAGPHVTLTVVPKAASRGTSSQPTPPHRRGPRPSAQGRSR